MVPLALDINRRGELQDSKSVPHVGVKRGAQPPFYIAKSLLLQLLFRLSLFVRPHR